MVFFLSGSLFAWQLKSLSLAGGNPIQEKNATLVTIIKNLESEIVNYETELNAIRERIVLLEKNLSAGEEDLMQMQETLQKARIAAGLVSLQGRGIKVIIDDDKAGLSASPNDDPNRYIIHYSHLMNIVNELKLGKAEAISINEQRLLTNSEIRCVGNVILINTTRLAPPFEIKAIGSPDLLEEALLSGEFSVLRNTGFPASYTKHPVENPLVIPGFTGAL
jgi:uncharacterized protein YlxW (UPF0749 family)